MEAAPWYENLDSGYKIVLHSPKTFDYFKSPDKFEYPAKFKYIILKFSIIPDEQTNYEKLLNYKIRFDRENRRFVIFNSCTFWRLIGNKKDIISAFGNAQALVKLLLNGYYFLNHIKELETKYVEYRTLHENLFWDIHSIDEFAHKLKIVGLIHGGNPSRKLRHDWVSVQLIPTEEIHKKYFENLRFVLYFRINKKLSTIKLLRLRIQRSFNNEFSRTYNSIYFFNCITACPGNEQMHQVYYEILYTISEDIRMMIRAIEYKELALDV